MELTAGAKQMLAEIVSQGDAWQGTIACVRRQESRLRAVFEDAEEVLFGGCGSGLNAAMAIAPAFQHVTGIRARAVPAAEVVFFPETVFVRGSKTILVLLSRSGSTTEVVRAADAARARGVPTLGVTCHAASPLVAASTEALLLEAANEESVTTTRSLTSMVLCGQLLGGVVARSAEYLGQLDVLPVLGRRVIERWHALSRAIGEDGRLARFAFVGQGPFIGLAREGQLKVKEMALVPADSYPLLDYRHGPKSTVDTQTLVAVLMSDRAYAAEIEFAAEMRSLGGRILALCDRADDDLAACAQHVVEVESGLADCARGVLYMPPIQLLAFYTALRLGRDPASPRHLSYWVATASLVDPASDGRHG